MLDSLAHPAVHRLDEAQVDFVFQNSQHVRPLCLEFKQHVLHAGIRTAVVDRNDLRISE
ncbi:hypothetical protein D3C85_1431590 [compost metagenome]